MQLAILSDIHDSLINLRKSLQLIETRRISRILFCGDFCSPFVIQEFRHFTGQADCVFGNNDGDRFQILKRVQSGDANITLHGEYAEINISDCNIAITHYPFYGKALAQTGKYQLVVAGHTHTRELWLINSCTFVNPGEIAGTLNPPGFAVYDIISGKVDFIDIE